MNLTAAVSGRIMQWLVMWCQVLLLAEGMHLMPQYYEPSTEVNCIEYATANQNRIGRMLREGWHAQKPTPRKIIQKRSVTIPVQFSLTTEPMSRRMDDIFTNIIPRGTHLLKEHAKLVQDINSLRQVVFISPFIDEPKDYDDSIFHEIIETAPTSTNRPSSFKPIISTTRPPTSSTRPPMSSTKGGSIPIILLGGASQRQVVKSQPITFLKPTISLVGTTVSPLAKHPYPFVNPQRKPVKICMTSIPAMFTTTRRPPTFWDKLIDYFIPARTIGR
ncbi:unnamed protein product [Spodoptera littoralis]|uniref:Uncharacterized protein n=1 Tax=Spodoptera littoralis TaxID=7109 RepID=A0A9P0IIP6_SPOLI|nr:unnamed protein product [Spodoptera littoralis]CAH1647600.1 unnamed protein product [Spodoptera littoralis]